MLFIPLLFSGCIKNGFDIEESKNKEVQENVHKVFGVLFDNNHDWCTTENGTINIVIPEGVEKVQLLAYVTNDDGEASLFILNEADVSNKSSIDMSYDVPKNNLGLMAAFLSKNNYTVKPIDNTRAKSRAATSGVDVTLPSVDLRIAGSIESYASKRGWIAGEQLYYMSDYESQKIPVADYDDEYKLVFRSVIFSHFKNGRNYNNLQLVKNSGVYNENGYPFTTGDAPIIVSPVYKNDGGYKEVENSDLYYYYYKDEDVVGDFVSYIESLPKYKAFAYKDCIKGDDVISKHTSYALIYWGDGVPDENTIGTYQFPAGYKIGFMVRAMTTAEGGKKQGELYSDGRLNNNINTYSKCNFKTSGLGTDGPRAAWITVNGKMMLCLESGTDKDFNDIIMEIEGGVEPILVIPELDNNYYTFCFEDREIGDYDMNDVVIKARRVNETTVEYQIVACGAQDKLKVMNINGSKINANNEVHNLFGVTDEFVNTVTIDHDPIVDRITVNRNFSFLDPDTQPYIFDVTTSKAVRLSKIGEDPHGIMIPYDFKYPKERVCIKNAYLRFNSWGVNQIVSTDWYVYPEEDKVF